MLPTNALVEQSKSENTVSHKACSVEFDKLSGKKYNRQISPEIREIQFQSKNRTVDNCPTERMPIAKTQARPQELRREFSGT